MMVGLDNSNAILEYINSKIDIERNENLFWKLLLSCDRQEIEDENSFDLLKNTYLNFLKLIRDARKCRIHVTVQKMKSKLLTCSNVDAKQAVKIAIKRNSDLFKELEDLISEEDSEEGSEEEYETDE